MKDIHIPLKIGMLFLGLFTAGALLVGVPLQKAYEAYCFHNWDLGIFAQAIERIGLNNPNPFLTVFDMRYFQDHFDPIVFLMGAVYSGISGGDPALFLVQVEWLLVFTSVLPVLLLAYSKHVSLAVAAFLACCLVFHRSVLEALYFPAHSVTWSLLPMMWTGYFLILKRYRLASCCFVLVLLCKEEYPFMGMAVAFVLALQGKRRPALAFFLLSLFCLGLAFGLRPWLLGSSGVHQKQALTGVGIKALADPKAAWQLGLHLLLLLAPTLPLFVWALRRNKAAFWQKAGIFLGALACLMAIRLTGHWWYGHRSAPLIAPLVLALAALLVGVKDTVPKSYMRLAWLALLMTGLPVIQRPLLTYIDKPFKKHCPFDQQRIASLTAAKTYLEQNPSLTILAQGHIVPHLVRLPSIHQLGTRYLALAEADALLFEHAPLGDSWPLSQLGQEQEIEAWKKMGNYRVAVEANGVTLLQRIETK